MKTAILLPRLTLRIYASEHMAKSIVYPKFYQANMLVSDKRSIMALDSIFCGLVCFFIAVNNVLS